MSKSMQSNGYQDREAGVLALAVAAMAGIALVACAPDAGGTGADAAIMDTSGAGREMPSLYVDRTVTVLEADGGNAALEGYRQALASCQEAGLPTRPLAEEDAARIGTERWQLWRTSGQAAYRVEEWGYTSGDSARQEHCLFQPSRSGYHEFFDATQSLVLDLESGSKDVQPANPDEIEVMPLEATDAESVAGWSGPRERVVQGQPCLEWRSADGAVVCHWSGGAQWGFDAAHAGQFESSLGLDRYNLVLEAAPAPGQAGSRLSTEQFVVNGPIDTAAMRPE
ncbi:hypothetical protein [Marilutibacter aestuarii]|uniref:Uncharacterized protein n=1 Tax=Marilutibacter aestuarii TaxID=1706195 RepID=A0A508AF28_9GAMM|nr:hypothetical protein [Lysobacter aestuarii]TQD45695.1 hypothetical protein FKV25_07660 [Lysobacter aestuarii]